MKKLVMILMGSLALSSMAGAQQREAGPEPQQPTQQQEVRPGAQQQGAQHEVRPGTQQQEVRPRAQQQGAQQPMQEVPSGQLNAQEEKLQAGVSALDQATEVADYYRLEQYFARLAQANPGNWLPWYYAAFCNAQIGFLYRTEGERIEPYSKRGEQQIKKALSLLDTSRQKAELAEVYVVMNRIYQSKVFINPMTYGQKYGVLAHQYMKQARQLSPENPRVIYLEAWFKYNAPKMHGGDKKKAKELAAQAMETLLASEDSGTAPHWGKRECQAILNK